MATGYIAMFLSQKDTESTAWARAKLNAETCVHTSLDQLLDQVKALPGQDLIGIWEVECLALKAPFCMVRSSDIRVLNYLGRPATIG